VVNRDFFKPEISFEDGVPLVPNITPVMVLYGTDYDIGYQYSRQLSQIFGPFALESLQRSLTSDEIAALKIYERQVKQFVPEFIDMFRGMVAGASVAGVDLSYEQVLADFYTVSVIDYTAGHMIGTKLPTYSDGEPAQVQNRVFPANDCSGFAAWGSTTKNHKLICASSEDHPLRHEFLAVVIPDTGNSYIFNMVILPPKGGHPAMNNKGLVYVHHGGAHGSGTAGREKPGYGIPQILAIQHTLRFACNANEALALQLGYPPGIPAAGLWADTGGQAFNLECRDPQTIRRSGDYGERDFLYATNTCMAESLQPFLKNMFGWPINYVPHGGWNTDDMNSVRRSLCMWNALHNYHSAVDLNFVKMLWRFPSQPPAYPTIEEAEIQLHNTQGAGWDSHIGNLANQMVGIVQPDIGDHGLLHICTGPAGRQAEPLSSGFYFYPTAPTHTFYELQLAPRPVDIVNLAQKRAQRDLYSANQELRKLTYMDVPYARLEAIFNRAATEFQKGDYYWGLTHGSNKKESICKLAKALRAFTKSQGYARQVYESLVLPPNKPTDLGLREWFGKWGQWEGHL
jgi:hypothetical protein